MPPYACLFLLVCYRRTRRAEQWPADLAQAVAHAGISLDGVSVHAQALGETMNPRSIPPATARAIRRQP